MSTCSCICQWLWINAWDSGHIHTDCGRSQESGPHRETRNTCDCSFWPPCSLCYRVFLCWRVFHRPSKHKKSVLDIVPILKIRLGQWWRLRILIVEMLSFFFVNSIRLSKISMNFIISISSDLAQWANYTAFHSASRYTKLIKRCFLSDDCLWLDVFLYILIDLYSEC